MVSEPLFALFWIPRDPGNRARRGAVLLVANIASRARKPKIDPKMGPTSSIKTTLRGLRRTKEVAPKSVLDCCSNSSSKSCLTIWEPKNSASKSIKAQPRSPRAAGGILPMLASCWVHFLINILLKNTFQHSWMFNRFWNGI